MRKTVDTQSRNKFAARISGCRSGLCWVALAMACAAGAGCATTSDTTLNDADSQRLSDVKSVAAPPVSSFLYMGVSSFEPIGESDLLVYTGPREAWLLHLNGTCRDLDSEPMLKLTSRMNRVSAGFDSVIVRNNPVPCHIQEIRKVDASALKSFKHPETHGSVEVETSVGTHPSGR